MRDRFRLSDEVPRFLVARNRCFGCHHVVLHPVTSKPLRGNGSTVTERERGILTEKQREYLKLGTDERLDKYSRQQRYRLRKNIQQRVRNGLLDFDVLFRNLDDDDLAEMFKTEIERSDVPIDTLLAHTPREIKNEAATIGIPPALAFFARVENTDGKPVVPGLESQPAFVDFTRSLEKGLQRYIAQSHRLHAEVSVSIEVTDAEPVADLIDQIETGDTKLNLYTLSVLENAGVSGNDLRYLVEQARNDQE